MLRAVVFLMSLISLSAFAYTKPVLGPTEPFTLGDGALAFEARIDTGASYSSLHAFDMHVIGGEAADKRDNIGKLLAFSTENEQGEREQLKAKIVAVSTIKNAQGVEKRYMVKLPLTFDGDRRVVKVNLRDRDHMDYKLLIGRNWLKGRYLVNVQTLPVIGAKAHIHINESGLTYKARIDTGAVESSLHAYNLHIENVDHKNMHNNVGKMITFTTANEAGETATVTTQIVNTSLIRNAQGSEIRYMVALTMGEPGKEYKVRVNLKNRSKMHQKLLIGRNWLAGHYLVDVHR